MVEKISLTNVQGAVLVSVGENIDLEKMAYFLDVNIDEQTKEDAIDNLVAKGYLSRDTGTLQLTEEGKRAKFAVGATLIAEQ